MHSFAGFLPLAILLPLAALILHGAAPSGAAPSGAVPARGGAPKSRNLAQAKAALVFQWGYGAFLVWISLMAMSVPEGLVLRGRGAPLGATSLVLEPTLYLDGRNAPFLLLLGLCLPLIFTWLRDRDGRYGPSYYVSANLLSLSLAGVFLSDSLVLFYLFWETALLGAYFWIGMHGRANIHSGSVYGALIRFFLFTLVGSMPMLVSIIALCAAAGKDPGVNGIAAIVNSMPAGQRWWVFAGFLLAFAVKLPLLGFHGWLRDTYNVSAPACRAVLSALMSKMGAYGLILVLAPGFPLEVARFAPHLQVLCVMGALYGALLCLAQDRLIDILVYSSLSHLSLVALGVFAAAASGDVATTGLTGAIFQVFNHGLIMAALFAFDARISTTGDSPLLSASGGLRAGQGRLAAVLLTAIFASASLPGLSNFAGEILVLFTAFRSSPWITFLASVGALIGAAALVRAFHRIFLGPRNGTESAGFVQAADFSAGETGLAVALIALWLVLGLYPMLFIQPVEKTILTIGAAGG
ncbi:MAG TPA: NADH-quinone oxidoreductase subunit M, partial [Fibrobacteria bacterium]|nr:NADH-quinone oxidoreductase subunit M [Fibrobacteria bacterium]